VKLQDALDCFYFVADWHALTDDLDTSDVAGNAVEMLADWLGAGLDPERSTLFVQSLVPEHAELHLLFSMTTPVTWLERVPTYRERIEQQHLESPSYGLLGYPLLQSADILMYKARWVPVGIDQVPHVELPREVGATWCRTAGIGCLDCKDVLLKHMLPPLSAIRERRQKFAEKPAAIIEILHEGSRRARKVAQATMEGVRAALRLTP